MRVCDRLEVIVQYPSRCLVSIKVWIASLSNHKGVAWSANKPARGGVGGWGDFFISGPLRTDILA